MLDPLPLKGRTAVVTGSGQNIGEAIAKLFSQAGANVVVNGASSREKVERVVAEIRETGGEAIGVMADVGDADAVEAMVDEAAETFGSVDIAVSNVSIRKKQPVEDISVKDWQDTINTNLNSAFYLARCVVPLMKKTGWGRIIHIYPVWMDLRRMCRRVPTTSLARRGYTPLPRRCLWNSGRMVLPQIPSRPAPSTPPATGANTTIPRCGGRPASKRSPSSASAPSTTLRTHAFTWPARPAASLPAKSFT